MKLSVLFGKKIISTAGKEGYVLSVTENGGTLACLVCADLQEREFTVGFQSVKSVKDKIIYSESTAVKYGAPVRLGKPAFDCEGNYLGKLTDFTVEKNVITTAHVGNKKFSADDVICGDAVIVKNSARILKSDVKKNGKVILRRGTTLTPEAVKKAQANGEYVQASLKTI